VQINLSRSYDNALFAMAQWPSEVTMVTSKGNDSVTVDGDLAGKIIQDLSWASSSSNWPRKIQSLQLLFLHIPL
jgi:hypothetical protein